jgi:hypothetical protein
MLALLALAGAAGPMPARAVGGGDYDPPRPDLPPVPRAVLTPADIAALERAEEKRRRRAARNLDLRARVGGGR